MKFSACLKQYLDLHRAGPPVPDPNATPEEAAIVQAQYVGELESREAQMDAMVEDSERRLNHEGP